LARLELQEQEAKQEQQEPKVSQGQLEQQEPKVTWGLKVIQVQLGRHSLLYPYATEVTRIPLRMSCVQLG
jgi:hypothetical protein